MSLSSSHKNLVALVLQQADVHPERVALAIPEDDKGLAAEHESVVTFGDLALRINQARAGLARHGFTRGDRK